MVSVNNKPIDNLIEVPYFPRKRAADMLSVHPRTIRRWIMENKIDACKFGHRDAWYISLPTINQFRYKFGYSELSKDEAATYPKIY